MCRYVIVLFICLAYSKKIICQSPSVEFDKLTSKPFQSPQAASLAKYIEVPISYYTGLAQNSIPIYEIKSDDISVPISLSYHGSGIKVSEEASWVGLGWTLDVAGIISHDIKGDDDEWGSNHQFNKVYPTEITDIYAEYSHAESRIGSPNAIYDDQGNTYTTANLQTVLLGGQSVDGEPDIYAYNFGKYSGKIFSGKGEWVDVNHNNIRFTSLGGTGFIAYTPDGYTYSFMTVEKAWSYPTPHATNTAYYLTSIVSPKGRVVNFQYKTFKTIVDENGWSSQFPNLSSAWGNDATVLQLPFLSEKFATHTFISSDGAIVSPKDATGWSQSYSASSTTGIYLDKIIFDNGYINFVKSSRSDLYGFKLDKIEVYNSSNTKIKSVNFSYGYFESNTNDDDMYNTSKVSHLPVNAVTYSYYPTSFRNKRLKLYNITIGPDLYTFDYNEASLPYKTSFNQDFWGYYNGSKNNPSLIPDYRLYSLMVNISNTFSSWIGADRTPNDNYIQAGMLKKIYYPTGGYVEFTYETNKFIDFTLKNTSSGSLIQQGGIDAGVGIQKFYFTLSSTTICNIIGGLYCNGMLDMNSQSYNCGCYTCNYDLNNTLYAKIEKVDPISHNTIQAYPAWVFDQGNNTVRNANGYINLPNQSFDPGTYCITVNYPDNHNPSGSIPNNRRAELYVNYYNEVGGQTSHVLTGAGLRVNKIKYYDPTKNQSLEKEYSYETGRLMHFPLFYSDAEMTYTDDCHCKDDYMVSSKYHGYYLYSTPATPHSFSANGSLGGYDKVTETILGTPYAGKSQYEYNNRPDNTNTQPNIYIPGVPSTAYLDNGFLKKMSIFDKDNNVIKEVSNTPAISIANTYWSFKSRLSLDAIGMKYTFNNYIQLSFYPIQVGKALTIQTVTKDYSNGAFIKTQKDFQYNDKGYLKEEKLTNSKTNSITTNYIYPFDYTGVTSGWINDLKMKNFIEVPLEKTVKKDGLVIGGSFVSYSTAGGRYVPNQVYSIETLMPKNILSTAPNGTIPDDMKLQGTITYDGPNILEQQKINDVNHSYLWGYNNTYPVAEAINASSNEIYATSFEEGGWDSKMSFSGSRVHSGNNAGYINNTTAGEIYSYSSTRLSLNLTASKKFHYSGWIYSSGPSAEIFLMMTTTVGGSYTSTSNIVSPASNANKWVLVEKDVDVPANVKEIWLRVDNNSTGSVWFDDLRLYPSDAQMTTYTYNPLIGMTSQSDVNNRINYYLYDGLGRLSSVKDKDGNIVKTYCYNYAGQLTNCRTSFQNLTVSKTFIKNDCTDTAFCGEEVDAVVNAGEFTSDSSQEEADSLAAAYLDTTGQSYANSHGNCLPRMSLILSNYEHIAGFTIQFTSVVDSSKVYILDFPEDADSTLTFQNIPQGRYNILISKTDNAQSFVFTVSGPNGDIQVNSDKASWVNVPVNGSTFNKIAIGIFQQ